MQPNELTRVGGEKLRELRNRLGFTARSVEERSMEIAAELQNMEYIVSHSWLTQVEHGLGVLSVFKFYSLARIYGRTATELAGFYQVPIHKLGRDLADFAAPKTHLVDNATDSETVTLPLSFRSNPAGLDDTNLLSGFTTIWGDLPIALLERLSPQTALYGYVGLKDLTLSPMIRPGTFVQIDGKQRRILPASSPRELDRPIYFIELRNGYACSWCELQNGRLLLVPHPLSPAKTRQLDLSEADIVGRVTGVAMTIAETPPGHSAPTT